MSKILTSRQQDYAQWYNDLVLKGGLADYSAVRGCMVIKPYGFALWENMKEQLDRRFRETGHQNAYFPLFIPKSFFSREAAHVDGFAKECAVVTHYRLKNDPEGKGIIVDPEARLEEELIVRPTSETIIWSTYKQWIQSYRDLPLLINQWANVVRWEMRTRLFLRTAEFLWQEGHTAHAERQEAMEEAERMLNVYAEFAEEYMAMPVIRGVKTASERFAGAEETFCIEALMQDGKALQAGTSHFLGQNFARAFDVQFQDKDNRMEYVWASSWGVSTRLVGGLIMTHGDDKGLVMPPRLAPVQVVMIPVYGKDEATNQRLVEVLKQEAASLQSAGIRVKLDLDENSRPGWKYAEYELKGVPIRLALGARDLEKGQVELARRDSGEKFSVALDELKASLTTELESMQARLLDRARKFQEENTHRVDEWDELVQGLEEKGGFFLAHWDGTPETEARIKELTKATIRCIPLHNPQEDGNCILTGRPSTQRVIFARAY